MEFLSCLTNDVSIKNKKKTNYFRNLLTYLLLKIPKLVLRCANVVAMYYLIVLLHRTNAGVVRVVFISVVT